MGELLESDRALESAVKGGLVSQSFSKLCHSLCSELKTLNELQESVSMATGAEDADAFELEMRSFLKELGCPHGPLVAKETGCILSNYRNKLLLIGRCSYYRVVFSPTVVCVQTSFSLSSWLPGYFL